MLRRPEPRLSETVYGCFGVTLDSHNDEGFPSPSCRKLAECWCRLRVLTPHLGHENLRWMDDDGRVEGTSLDPDLSDLIETPATSPWELSCASLVPRTGSHPVRSWSFEREIPDRLGTTCAVDRVKATTVTGAAFSNCYDWRYFFVVLSELGDS